MESIPVIKPASEPIQHPERITIAAMGLIWGNGESISLDNTAVTVKTEIHISQPVEGLPDSKDNTPQIIPVNITARLIR